MRRHFLLAGSLVAAATFTVLGTLTAAASPAAHPATNQGASAQLSAKAAPASGGAGQRALPDILGCTNAPTPEVPGRGLVGFFESAPKTPPPAADPFAPNSTTSIYEQYGYAGLRWNTYDLGCGPDLARSPDAAVGNAVANWIIALPKAAVAATGAILGAAFQPDFLGVFDPLISNVVDTLRHAIFEQWAFVVLAALGVFVMWRARQASLASTAAAIGWALIVMVLVTMVFRWPLVAGHAADETVTTTLGAVTGGFNHKAAGTSSDAGTEATAGMHEALLYQSWLGGTFGDANSDVAKKYGPVIFDATALTWRQAQILQTDPGEGKKIIDAKEKKFEDAASKIKDEDPDAYEYLTGRRSDTRVGYAILASLATLCAVPFLFVAGLLVLGALIIVRFGVMLFPAFATLGLFPTMRTLVTGIGSVVAAALINAIVFGIGAAVTVLGMGVLLAPSTGVPPWLDIILMLLLTIVMWVALRPFRRLTQMVSSQHNHFASASGGVSTVTRSAARTSGRILSTALGTFLGVSAAARGGANQQVEAQAAEGGTVQRSEANTSYQPLVTAPAEGAPPNLPPAETGVPGGPPTAPAYASGGAAKQPAALSSSMQINAGAVTVVGPASGGAGRAEHPGEIYAPAGRAGGSRAESGTAAHRAADGADGAGLDPTGAPAVGGRFESGGAGSGAPGNNRGLVSTGPASSYYGTAMDGLPDGRPTDRGFQRPEGAPADDFDLDELNEVFRPDKVRQQ